MLSVLPRLLPSVLPPPPSGVGVLASQQILLRLLLPRLLGVGVLASQQILLRLLQQHSRSLVPRLRLQMLLLLSAHPGLLSVHLALLLLVQVAAFAS